MEQFYHKEKEELGKDIYPFLQQELKDVPAGSKGLIASHWIFGERPPFFGDDARGVFLNIGSQHDRRYMLNAMMESVCYSIKMALDALEDGTGRRVDVLHAIGGGTLNDHWMQMLSDVLQIPICIPTQTRHGGTVGTAYCALIGLGVFKSFDEIKERIEMERWFRPRKENKAVYEKMCAEYAKVYPLLKNTFQSLR